MYNNITSINVYLGDGDWYNDNCGSPRGFACKKVAGNDVTFTIPATTSVPGDCPQGSFGSGDYYHIHIIILHS